MMAGEAGAPGIISDCTGGDRRGDRWFAATHPASHQLFQMHVPQMLLPFDRG